MAENTNSEVYDMTPETKAYLDQQFAHLERRIQDITNPLKENVQRLRDDIAEIFNRVGAVETKVAILEDNKSGRQSTITVIISIVFGLAMMGLAIIGFLL